MRKLRTWLIYGTLALAVTWVGLFLLLVPGLPDTTDLYRVRHSPGVTVVAADGTVLERRGAFNSVFVSLKDLPPYLPQATIATEDRRFYDHFGMDVVGFGRAALANLRAGRIVQGGSTITQQLAKNLFLTPERTFVRKLRELILAVWLESRLSKDEILTLYLNRIYFGGGTYGVEAAAHHYFGKPVQEISLAEAAMLIGLLKAPTRYAPTNDLELARARAAQVLDNMVDAGFVDTDAAEAGKRQPAQPVRRSETTRQARYFVDWVVDRLPDWATSLRDDIVVFTTLDPSFQAIAERAVQEGLDNWGVRRRVGQAAFVAFDGHGAIKAMVGGASYQESQFNRVTQARRQPGSAFKPVVYLAALEHGIQPDTLVDDAPVIVDGWQPQNFDGRHRGQVSVVRALADSVNTVAVRLSEKVGRENVIAVARRLGITTTLAPHPSLALGASEVTPFELVAAYIPFANGGWDATPYAVVEIRTRGGVTVYRHPGIERPRIIEANQVAAMNDMLAEALVTGTGKVARLDGRPAAGKTGTSQGYRDGWFVGYVTDLAAGVWIGNDDNTPMDRVGGGQVPAWIWHRFMVQATEGTPVRPLPGREEDGLVAVEDIVTRAVSWLQRLFRAESQGDGAQVRGETPDSIRRATERNRGHRLPDSARSSDAITGEVE